MKVLLASSDMFELRGGLVLPASGLPVAVQRGWGMVS